MPMMVGSQPASEDAVTKHSLTPLARIVGYGVAGCEPTIMGIGPVPAIEAMMEKTGVSLNGKGVLGDGVLAGDNDCCCPVTNPRGGPGSHHSSFLEHGGQLGQLLDGGLGLGVLVQAHLYLALLGLEHHGPDLVREVAGLGGGTPRLLGPE